jgi:AraC-like DNA-binding protein
MRLAAFPPSERLRPYVRSISVMETDRAEASAVLPQPGLMLGFRYAGSATLFENGEARRVADAGIVGVRNTLRRMQTSAGGGIVVIAFTELGARVFFEQPLHEFFGGMIALDDVWPRAEFRELEERLGEARTNEARAHLVDRYLCGRLREQAPDPVVAAAVRSIQRRGGAIRIGALAKELGISQDPLEKRFRRVVGASPKQLASLLRFRRVVERYARGERLTTIAHEVGYFDQSHLIREFRAVTGESPERFLSARGHW